MDQMVQIVVLLDCIAVIIWVSDGTNAVNNVVNVIESLCVRVVCVCWDSSLIILSTIVVDLMV